MASKVNMRFIVILGAALALALVGVVVTAYFAVKKTGEQNVELGDEAAARGEWDKAVQMYSKAVAKNNENVEWISKWIGAMEKTTPGSPQEYREAYHSQYMLALRALATADASNPDSVARVLEEQYRWSMVFSGGLQTWESMHAAAEEQIRFFRGDDAGRDRLRAYRGLAQVEIVSIKSDPSEAELKSATDDLEAVLRQEPSNTRAIMGLTRIGLVRANLHTRRNEPDEARAEREAVRAMLEKFVTEHPPAPPARLALLQVDLIKDSETAERGTTFVSMLRNRRTQVQQLIDSVMGERPEKLEVGTIAQIAQYASAALDEGGNAADMMFTHALQGRPNDPQVLSSWALMDINRGELERALDRLQKIVDLPDQPLSLAGRVLQEFRGRAVGLQANVIFDAWASTTDVAERERYKARLDDVRNRLTQFVPEGDPQLMSVDGRREYMAGDMAGARRLLGEYVERTAASDAASVHLLGDLLASQQDFGAAKKMYERALELNPRNLRVMRSLAVIAAGELDYAAAVRYLTSAVALAPQDTALAGALAEMKEREAGEKTTDPVMKIVNEARTMSTGVTADWPAATAKLRDGLRQYPTDLRLHLALVNSLVVQNDKEGAVQAVRAALTHHPENARLKAMDRNLNDPDPLTSQLEAIAQTDAPAHRQALARAIAYARAGRVDDYNAELDKAIQLSPEDPEVFEARFGRALAAKDRGQIDDLCRTAEQKNLDNARGAICRARRDLAFIADQTNPEQRRRDLEAVATTIRGTLAQDRLNFGLWRMLGQIQLELAQAIPGQVDPKMVQAASESLARAFEIRPTDPTTANLYIVSLIELRAYDRGLEVARRLEPTLSTDPEFVEWLIRLETAAPGGDREKAIRARKQIAARSPENLSNLQSLVSLLTTQGRFEEAAASITALRALNPRAATAAEARLLARQGRTEDAVRQYRAFIEATPEAERQLGDYVAAAQFMFENNRVDDAVAILRQGAPTQNPAVREIDRSIADLLFNAGRMDEAAKAYGELLRAGIADSTNSILKRAIEANIQVGRYEVADELLASAPQATGDATLLILQAQVAAGKKEADRARRLLDQAVTAAPESALVYIKRAEFTSQDPSRARDVEADLEQALRLDPANMSARRMLATHYFRTSRAEQGVEQMRRAMAGNPGDEKIRLELIDVLQALGRAPEALDVMEDSLKRFPGDTAWRVRAAQLFTRHQRWERAAAVVGELWQLSPNAEIAENYAFVLTGGPNPDMNRAVQVLSTPELKIDDNPRLLLTRARVFARGNKPDQAMNDILAAWAKTNQADSQAVAMFYLMLEGALPQAKDQLTVISRLERRERLTGWAQLYAAGVRLRVPETAAQGESELRAMAEADTGEPRLRLAIWRAIGGIEYQNKRFEEALKAFRRGLTFDPADPELNNNVAYTLGVDLKRPSEALPFAEKAAEAAPSSSMILDTLGAIYQALGRHDAAAPILEKALNYGTSPAERVPAALHLAQSRRHSGDRVGARQLADEAGRMIEAAPALRTLYDDKLKELRRLLDSE